MTARHDDAEGFDAGGLRNSHPAMEIGFRGITFSVWGASVFMALSVLAIISANLYAGYRVELAVLAGDGALRAMAAKEHDQLSLLVGRTSCAQTLSKEDLLALRQQYKPGLLSHYCPWLRE